MIDIKSFKGVLPKNGKKLHIETYGCQMNTTDSEIVISILEAEGYTYTENVHQADVILINTCSIRDNAEQRIFGRLGDFKRFKKERDGVVVGVIGCMAERLKEDLMTKDMVVDIVAGPDAYRRLPTLIEQAMHGQRSIDVVLDIDETYHEITPVRLDKNGVSAFVAIMRGCNNFCTYCVVPYTRGRERSRKPSTIIGEVRDLYSKGYKEVTLLGQNVNSYKWEENGETIDFPTLVSMTASVGNDLRVRFSTSHPKDISDSLIEVIAQHKNVCNSIHLPAQSGNDRILKLMNRHYNRAWYMERIAKIRELIPDCTISTDIIAGFCSETEEEHKDTISLMQEVGYILAYMFKYSERPNTKAHLTMKDDVSEEVKTRRLSEIIDIQRDLSLKSNKQEVGKSFEVLAESFSKRSDDMLVGRTEYNKVVVFPREG
ncbi:MAG: tRNA (N6-isopentenyl adenosine(37)-C2)-methylthiotransferase MiaB, partial [Rikenellaceae bacterium]